MNNLYNILHQIDSKPLQRAILKIGEEKIGGGNSCVNISGLKLAYMDELGLIKNNDCLNDFQDEEFKKAVRIIEKEYGIESIEELYERRTGKKATLDNVMNSCFDSANKIFNYIENKKSLPFRTVIAYPLQKDLQKIYLN